MDDDFCVRQKIPVPQAFLCETYFDNGMQPYARKLQLFPHFNVFFSDAPNTASYVILYKYDLINFTSTQLSKVCTFKFPIRELIRRAQSKI